VIDVSDRLRNRLVTLCNHCRSHYDDMKVRETASLKTCGECEMFKCPYNPRKAAYEAHVRDIEARQLPSPAAASAGQSLISMARSN
jgi:hypothetical protein